MEEMGKVHVRDIGEQMELRITLTRLTVIRQLSRNLIYWALTFELRLLGG